MANTSLDRLALQVASLQDGFELLSRSSTLKELARQLFHLLRGNLTVVEAQIVVRERPSAEWQVLFTRGTWETLDDVDIPAETTFVAKAATRARSHLDASHPLVEGAHVAVLLGHKLDRSHYSDRDRLALQIILQVFASAYLSLRQRQNEKSLIFSLNHRLLQLNSLIDTGIKLSKLRPGESLRQTALEQAAALTNASRGIATVSLGRATKERTIFPVGATMRRPTGKSHRIRSSFKFSGLTYAFELHEKEDRAGTGPFDDTDQLLLDAIAQQVHAAMEVHYLHAQDLEKQKIERDIAFAASIQQRILPKTLPAITGYDLAGVNIPTRLVGGDYYDCIPLNDGRYALVIADVSGKGVPAALLVSSFHAYLSAYLEDHALLDLTRKLNTAIYRTSTEERYITAAMAIFTPETGELECVNAGHTPLYLLRNDNSLQEIANGGLALGMLELDLPYQTDHVTMAPGDRLLLYTDGVTEAMNAQGELYDADGALKEFVKHHKPGGADVFIKDLLADLGKFTGSAPQNDDITAMYLIRKESPGSL